MYKKNKKSGFTLMELMVFLLFLSIVFAAATPIITKRIKLPQKVYHGRYICYRDSDGVLREARFNSTRMLPSEPVTECSFTPPKNASMFKIELVGAGAGGINYSDIVEDNDIREGTFSYRNGSYQYVGDRYANLTNGQIRAFLLGKSYRISQKTGVGGVGQNIYSQLADANYEDFTYDYVPSAPEKIYDVDGVTVADQILRRAKTRIKALYSSKFGSFSTRNCYRKVNWLDDDIDNERSDCYIAYDNNLVTDVDNTIKIDPGLRVVKASGFYTVVGDAGDSNNGVNIRESKQRYIYVEGKVPFKDTSNNDIPLDSTIGYLNSLFGSYLIKGSTGTAGATCGGWKYSDPEDGNSYLLTDAAAASLSHSGVYYGENGGDVERYAAIRIYNSCFTNQTRSTGGKGGWIATDLEAASSSQVYASTASGREGITPAQGYIVPYTHYLTLPADYAITGVKSFGITEDSNNPGDMIPGIGIETDLNIKHYKIGESGTSAADAKTYYVPSLGSDCKFSIPSGGPAVEYSNATQFLIKDLESSLAVGLTCNSGNLRLVGTGGKYNVTLKEETYNPFDYIDIYNQQVDLSGIPSEYKVEPKTPSIPYTNSSIFNKFRSGIFDQIGLGGKGSIITDKCTAPKGSYKLSNIYNGVFESGSGSRISIPGEECNPEEDIAKTKAQPGRGGAVIISW